MTGTTKKEIVQAISEVIPELTHKEIEKMIRLLRRNNIKELPKGIGF